MKMLVTGAAGFIGFHLAKRLLEEGHEVIGIDNMNDYYDVSLKEARLAELKKYPVCHSEPQAKNPGPDVILSEAKNPGRFTFIKMDIADREAVERLFSGCHCEPGGRGNPGAERFDRVFHMAAQAGVRYSIDHPHVYVQSNLVGFLNILEGCRHLMKVKGQRSKVKDENGSFHLSPSSFHLIFASSSSVYGNNTKLPFSVHDNVDHPISLYAATKKSNELMAHTYSHLYGIPATGLRFFTAYGPWGRPDMAYFKFTRMIQAGETIEVFNDGDMERDFTYIDDVIEGVVRVGNRIPASVAEAAPYKMYNIGNHSPVGLMKFISTLEGALGVKAKTEFKPMQPGDVKVTYADVDDLMNDVGYCPSTTLKDGLTKFVEWYKQRLNT